MNFSSVTFRWQLLKRIFARNRPAGLDVLPSAVREAMGISSSALKPPSEAPELREVMAAAENAPDKPAAKDLFTHNGKLLPCWLPADENAADGEWLTSSRNYPFYFALFSRLNAGSAPLRMFEIGVRTGYTGAVFAKAAPTNGAYFGLDPNVYVANGLELASATLRQLRADLGGFNYTLLEGYSWDVHVQNSLRYTGPFDIIHVDGDHTLAGKLVDLDLSRQLISPTGIVLIDDYDHHHDIIDGAVRRALHLGWFRTFAYLPTFRGLAVLKL